jgi:hypothetical protein
MRSRPPTSDNPACLDDRKRRAGTVCKLKKIDEG